MYVERKSIQVHNLKLKVKFISQCFLLNHLNCLGQFVSLPLAQDGNICFNQHISDSTYITIKIKVSSGDVSLASP